MFWRKKGLLGGGRKWGVLLLGLWLIVTGILHFAGGSSWIPRSADVLAVLALLAGILILLDR